MNDAPWRKERDSALFLKDRLYRVPGFTLQEKTESYEIAVTASTDIFMDIFPSSSSRGCGFVEKRLKTNHRGRIDGERF